MQNLEAVQLHVFAYRISVALVVKHPSELYILFADTVFDFL